MWRNKNGGVSIFFFKEAQTQAQTLAPAQTQADTLKANSKETRTLWGRAKGNLEGKMHVGLVTNKAIIIQIS
jgi:hypothetical protein